MPMPLHPWAVSRRQPCAPQGSPDSSLDRPAPPRARCRWLRLEARSDRCVLSFCYFSL